jgi:SAM-dependent methyltransferase
VEARAKQVHRRSLFDPVADLYADARPHYPAALVNDLIALGSLDETRRVLEIGAGTGQLTAALARSGASITAVELGANLTRRLKRSVEGFANVRAVNADFDTWMPPSAAFDLVVAATSFHWLDPGTRVAKCAGLLRAGGSLAVIDTHYGAGSAASDPFSSASQACYASWDPEHDPRRRPHGPEPLDARNEELARCAAFTRHAHRQYVVAREYLTPSYCDLLRTMSDVRRIDEPARSSFLACIASLIDERFAGKITRMDVHDLWSATKGFDE